MKYYNFLKNYEMKLIKVLEIRILDTKKTQMKREKYHGID